MNQKPKGSETGSQNKSFLKEVHTAKVASIVSVLLSLILSARQQTKPSLSDHQGPALGSTQTQGSVCVPRGHATANTHRSQWACYGGVTPQRATMWSQAIRDGSEDRPQSSLGAEMSLDGRLNSEFKHGNRGPGEDRKRSQLVNPQQQKQRSRHRWPSRNTVTETRW